MHYEILNRKKSKEVLNQIERQWGTSFDPGYVFLKNKENLYITTKALERLPFDAMRVNSCGLYVAEVRDHQVRLSIEGSQLLGPDATRNIIDLDENQIIDWIRGYDIPIEAQDSEGFLLVRHGADYYGSGKLKQGNLLNFFPKARRLKIQS